MRKVKMQSFSVRFLLGLMVTSFTAYSPIVVAQNASSSSKLEPYRVYISGQDALLRENINSHIPLHDIIANSKLTKVGLFKKKNFWYMDNRGSLSKVLTNESDNIVGTLTLSKTPNRRTLTVSLDVDGDRDVDLMRVISSEQDILIASEASGLGFLTRELQRQVQCIGSGRSSDKVDARAHLSLSGCSGEVSGYPDSSSRGLGQEIQEKLPMDGGMSSCSAEPTTSNPIGRWGLRKLVSGILGKKISDTIFGGESRTYTYPCEITGTCGNYSSNQDVPNPESGETEVNEDTDAQSSEDSSQSEASNDEESASNEEDSSTDQESTSDSGSSNDSSPVPGVDTDADIGTGSSQPELGGCWSQNLNHLQNALLNARSAKDLDNKALQTDCLESVVNPGSQNYKNPETVNVSCKPQVEQESDSPTTTLPIPPTDECNQIGSVDVGICDGVGIGKTPGGSGLRSTNVKFTELIEAIYGIETGCDPRVCNPGN